MKIILLKYFYEYHYLEESILEYEKRKKFIINCLYGGSILFFVYIMLQYGLPLLSPFLFAFIIAYLLRKPAKFLSAILKIPYKLIAFLMVLLFYCIIGLFIFLLGLRLFSYSVDLISDLPSIYTTYIEPFLYWGFNEIEKTVARMDPALIASLNDFSTQFTQSLGELISNVSMKAVSAISGYASSIPGLFIKLLLMIISTFFIIGDYDKIVDFTLRQFSGKSKELIIHIKEYIVNTLFVCIRSYGLIMSITFVELSIGFLVIGIPNAMLIAFCIALFDILPILGTGGIMIPWTVIAVLQGNYSLAISLFIVYLIVTIIRNIIEPKIVGSQIGLHPIVTLVSMFVGAHFFGVLGLFGFPITLSLLHHLNDAGTIKLFK